MKLFLTIALFLCVETSLVTPLYARKNFILISAPGSGKGTFSQYLVQNHGYVQICPGDIFRSEIREQTALGKKIQPIVDRGDYVEEDIVCALIADNLLKAIKQQKQFIIDGFPRSEHSFIFLHKFLQENNLINDVCFLQFIAADQVCVQRILGRQICTECFKVYNLITMPAKSDTLCDDCGVPLVRRKADTESIVKNRLNYFHTHIEPLMRPALALYEIKYITTECSLEDLKATYDTLIK